MRAVALTGYGQSSNTGRTRRSGFDVHLVKPIDIETLLHAIDQPRG